MIKSRVFGASALAVAALSPMPLAAQSYLETPPQTRPRLVVTTDPELDDANSMLRYLLYANDVDTVGLVYASSAVHWSGDDKGTLFNHPDREYSHGGAVKCPCTSYRWPKGELHIDRAVDAYAKVYGNLRQHDRAYPSPDQLRAVIRWGNVDFEGDITHDTAGSDLIRSLLLDDVATPVYLLAWGGESTIARALKSIEEQYKDTPQWPAIRAKVIAKAVIVPSGHQDDSFQAYIKPVWPQIRYLEYADGVPLGYGAQAQVSEEDSAYFSAAWTKANVLERGPMGAMYRVWGDGRQMVPDDKFDFFGISGRSAEQLKADGYTVWTPLQEKGSFISEGDTPTFLNFVRNGLQGFHDATAGGWAGHRMTKADAERMEKLFAMFMQNPAAVRLTRHASDPFVGAAQNDFAARLLWTTTPAYAGANHAPVVTLASPQMVEAKRGQTIKLVAEASDPDGQHVTMHWRRWAAADDYAGSVKLQHADQPTATLTVPRNAKTGQTFQILAEVTDSGTPALTGYAKVVVRVRD
ncbi:DUF1593 domain-containing protein [Novosphingobium umbonatum]|uniref:DUF1593 domain-containing protein n=1 Tax=Novosphingobium umbonatum TaxID=1908524 RepID=A0A3S2UT70_9SPHN|nr:DUF1593 domain-containing protein [Novosphingobium umbonatum]RVU05662.1 DUF1593 domain-containing protein [Novosphingobium umbonatum]